MQEIYRETREELAYDVTAGRITALRRREVMCSEARIVEAGQLRSAQHVGLVAEAALVARARAASETAVDLPHRLPAGSRCMLDLLPEAPRQERLLAATQEALELLQDRVPQVKVLGQTLSNRIQRELRTDEGTDCQASFEQNRLTLTFRHERSASILEGGIECMSATTLPFRETVEDFLPLLAGLGRPSDLPAGRLPVAMPWPEQLLLKRLAEALRADRYQQGASLLAGKLGEPVFAPEVGLDDVALLPESGIVAPFDGDGAVRSTNPSSLAPADHRVTLIEAGRPSHLLADTAIAARYGVPCTANGIRTFAQGVQFGFHGLQLRPGARPRAEILAHLPACVLVATAMGGGLGENGVFSTPVMLAFLLRHGEVVGQLPSLNVRAPLRELLGSRLVGISSDGFGPAEANPCLVSELDVAVAGTG